MGCVSKMSVLKVWEVVWEVFGFSGTVGFGSPSAISHSQKFLKLDLQLARRPFDIDADDLTVITIAITVVMSASS